MKDRRREGKQSTVKGWGRVKKQEKTAKKKKKKKKLPILYREKCPSS